MDRDLPKLAILPLDSLILHERHDDQRAYPLAEGLRTTGTLRNPPIVARLPDHSGRFVVLDGANRNTALSLLNIPHTLAQIVEPDYPGLRVKTWNHVLWNYSAESWLADLHSIPNVTFTEAMVETAVQGISVDRALSTIRIAGGNFLIAETQSNDLYERVACLNAIFSSYKERANLERTSLRDLEGFNDIFPDLCGMVIFPHFEIGQVLDLASQGILLPAGVTRFAVSPRALRVNYPLEELRADKSIDEKNQSLKTWLKKRIKEKSIRYYREHTVLYDE